MLYRMFMPKRGVSVTLRDENLLWLKSRTVATKGRSLSETLDELVTAARTSRDVPAAAVRSVVGTVDIAADDPDLERADDDIRDIVTGSLARPFLVREEPPRYGNSRSKKAKRTGRG
jgi:hypothetical protein